MKRRGQRRLRHGGFTLLEVLLVLMILIILTSTVSFSVLRAQKTAHINAARAQMGLFKSMLENFALDCGSYPSSDMGLTSLRSPPDGIAKWNGPYSKSDIPADPWGSPYQYSYDPGSDAFMIWSLGPDGQPDSGDEVQMDP